MESRSQKSEVRGQQSVPPLFIVDSDGISEVRIFLVGGGYLKVTGPAEFVYEDNSAGNFKDNDK